ncbi:acyl-CoA dehydrogenase [Noviherbaspirillum sp.]|uniref:acyl-CoA dehydrogenase n=1 Tax=Noviherbaspirillum sp. TaxID=1926288 RepID=UPI002D3BA4FD|nr:acyl-CoA dehydrogenase [Noviherbaspirillum sp.]HZW19993.1 acyl-CoA dehydrogenase [Noviherbaspirillum sp.]
MNAYAAPLRDMQFILRHLADLEQIGSLPNCEEASVELTEAVLDEAARFSAGVLAPLNPMGDAQGCRVENGRVVTPDGWIEAYAEFRDAGWVGLGMAPEFGGQGLPKLVAAPVTEMFYSANMAFNLLPPMAQGAAETLLLAANEQLKSTFVPKLASGEWTATMDLTEPNAGSDLSAMKTRAVPHADGSYRLFGQKIFITYGDHELADNIVHLVLARLPDAPPGVRGISMFVVPKFLVGEDGTPGARNDMQCIAVEHKMGIRGSPTCVMSYGDKDGAVGYLVGEPNCGLEYMFVMVNETRFNVGLQGIALAERAWQKALEYAGERRQGRDAQTGETNVPIIRHPDVRRMLLAMRARVMAARMLAYTAAGWFDRARCDPHPERSKHSRQLLDLLMPVVKGWGSELGIEVANLGIQIHGGMGFVEEAGVAQYLRDVRITSIYEGTTGIQGQDLINRKTLRDKGEAFRLLIAEMRAAARRAEESPVAGLGARLMRSIDTLQEAVDWVLFKGEKEMGEVLSASTPFLHLAGITCGGWQLVRAATAAAALRERGDPDAYFNGIIGLAEFYFTNIAPHAAAHATAVMEGARAVHCYQSF